VAGKRKTLHKRANRAVPARAAHVSVAAFALALVLLGLSAAAGSAASFTWSGAAPLGTANWSNASNWGGAAPSGSVETLSFPALTGPACASEPPTATCYIASNAIAGLSVEGLEINDGVSYGLTGEGISLGAGGIKAATTSNPASEAALKLPITLTAPQTWSISAEDGLGQLSIANVTGSFPLQVDLSNQVFLGLGESDVEVGPVSVVGVSSTLLPGSVSLGGGPAAGSLNATDENPVSFNGGAGLAAFNGATGPLTMHTGELQTGSPTAAGVLSVNGAVTLESTELSTFILGPGTVAGTDYSQLSAHGTVSLTDATLRLNLGDPGTCPALTAGTAYKILITAGSILGTFAAVPDGASVRIGATTPCAQPDLSARITYTANEVIATLQAGEPSQSSVPAPVLGKRETARVIGGRVSVRVKGSSKFVALSGATSIPDGSELDTAHGRVQITAATTTPGKTESAEVYAGRFLLHQSATSLATTHMKLTQPLTGCRAAGSANRPSSAHASAAPHHPKPKSRHLWASESGGSWGTSGRYVSTTVEGTRWLTLDECARSEVEVTQGVVRVRDLIHRRTRTITAGHTYIASRSNKRPRQRYPRGRRQIASRRGEEMAPGVRLSVPLIAGGALLPLQSPV
jgi:hypothetical protein